MTGESTNPNERLGIVGSGAIATGLARLAGARFDVILRARSDASAQRAAAVVEDLATVVTDLDALCETTIVVEAIAEDHAVKCELHGVLGELLPAEVPVSSTTSSLSAQALADASGRPELFAAAHFFNPVEKMPLVELAFPRRRPRPRARWLALCEALGKTVVEVPDSPGFVVNRLLFPYLFEAVRLQQDQGLDAEAVDTCMKLGAGHPMGPLELLDFVGLDVSAAIGDSIGVEVPDLGAADDRRRRARQEGRRRASKGRVRAEAQPGRRAFSSGARFTGAGMPAVRSQTTSASPIPWAVASSTTESHGSVASGRSSQRARSSASSEPSWAPVSSSRSPSSSRRASRCVSLSLTHHI